MDASLLDTDMLSEILKQRNPAVVQKSAVYLQGHGQFALSAFTRFEIERGYREKKATRLLARFRTFCQHSLVLPVTDAIFDRAADLWVLALQGGHPRGDADGFETRRTAPGEIHTLTWGGLRGTIRPQSPLLTFEFSAIIGTWNP